MNFAIGRYMLAEFSETGKFGEGYRIRSRTETNLFGLMTTVRYDLYYCGLDSKAEEKLIGSYKTLKKLFEKIK